MNKLGKNPLSFVLIYVLKHVITLPNVIPMIHFPLYPQLPLSPCTGACKLDQPSVDNGADNV